MVWIQLKMKIKCYFTNINILKMLNFLNGLIQHPFFVYYWDLAYQYENLKLASQYYRAWSDCMDVQAGLAIYHRQRLIIFISSKVRVKGQKYIIIFFYCVLCHTNTVKIIWWHFQLYWWKKTSGAPSCIISDTSRHLSRTTNVQ